MSAEKPRKRGRKSGEVVGFAGVPNWLSQAELMRVTGLSRQTLAELAREPDCPQKQSGNNRVYPWPGWMTWYTERRVARAVERVRPADYDEAKARKTAAEAELAELELARERGDLVAMDDAMVVFEDRLERLRARLVAIPSKEAHRFLGLTKMGEAVGELRSVVDGVMGEISGEGDD